MKKLKVIMIDAFKPSYLEYAPYLKALTEKYFHGELDIGFGHWRGVEILFNGKSDTISVFYQNNENSLNYLKYFRWLEYLGGFGRFIIDVLFNFPRLMKGYELFSITNMPISINRLSKFDVSVKKHAGKKYDFYYFPELDDLAHKYGTKSREVIEVIKKIDKKISEMKWDLIFSDHGMVDVDKTLSVPITKNCFIDSDMARYWGNKEELMQIKEKLPLKYGKIIKWNEKYGQLIFLANTGVLIFPNFWNKELVKAMHGYDGKHKDMKAFYILKKSGNKKNLKAEKLHEELENYKKQLQ